MDVIVIVGVRVGLIGWRQQSADNQNIRANRIQDVHVAASVELEPLV